MCPGSTTPLEHVVQLALDRGSQTSIPTVHSAHILDVLTSANVIVPMPPRIDTLSRDTIAARAAKTNCAFDRLTSIDRTATE